MRRRRTHLHRPSRRSHLRHRLGRQAPLPQHRRHVRPARELRRHDVRRPCECVSIYSVLEYAHRLRRTPTQPASASRASSSTRTRRLAQACRSSPGASPCRLLRKSDADFAQSPARAATSTRAPACRVVLMGSSATRRRSARHAPTRRHSHVMPVEPSPARPTTYYTKADAQLSVRYKLIAAVCQRF